MKEVGVLEAKTHLSALLEELEQTGEPVAITRHGQRVARLTLDRPGGRRAPPPGKTWAQVADEIITWREEMARRNPRLAEPYDLRADRDSIE